MLRITFTFFLTTKINTAGLYFEILFYFGFLIMLHQLTPTIMSELGTWI